jgi:DNA-binding NarL/FixJ family response regulator
MEATKPLILLADDDTAFLEGLRRLLEPEFRIAESVGDGRALVEAAQARSPDLIVADISMPLLNGFQALRRLKVAQPNARVIFLTVHEEPAFVSEAMKSGAQGYVLKRCAPFHLIPAIRAVLQGSLFVCPAPVE